MSKTTLALEIAKSRPSIYLDLENEGERVKLSSPPRYFADHERELVILDEVHRVRSSSRDCGRHRPGQTAGQGERALPVSGVSRNGFAAAVWRKSGWPYFLCRTWAV
ncbi:MAG: hypothetical protein WBG11_13745 [Methylocella sp.]